MVNRVVGRNQLVSPTGFSALKQPLTDLTFKGTLCLVQFSRQIKRPECLQHPGLARQPDNQLAGWLIAIIPRYIPLAPEKGIMNKPDLAELKNVCYKCTTEILTFVFNKVSLDGKVPLITVEMPQFERTENGWSRTINISQRIDFYEFFKLYRSDLIELDSYRAFSELIQKYKHELRQFDRSEESIILNFLDRIIDAYSIDKEDERFYQEIYSEEFESLLLSEERIFQGVYLVDGLHLEGDEELILDENHQIKHITQDFLFDLQNYSNINTVFSSATMDLYPNNLILIIKVKVPKNGPYNFQQSLEIELEKVHLTLSMVKIGGIGFNALSKHSIPKSYMSGTIHSAQKIFSTYEPEKTEINIGQTLFYWKKINDLWPNIKIVCEIACKRIMLISSEENLTDKFVDLIIGLESLYSTDSVDIGYKLALRSAVAVAKSDKERNDFWLIMNKAYGLRSDIVHGKELEPTKKLFFRKKLELDLLGISFVVNEILNRSILVFAELAKEIIKKNKGIGREGIIRNIGS